MNDPKPRSALLRRTLRAGIVAVALAAGVTLATAAMARPGHHGPHRGGPLAHLERGLQALDLDDATLQTANGIIDAAREEGRSMRTRMRDAHEAMRNLLEQETPDRDAVLAQAEAIGDLQTEARKQELSTLLQVQALLTPEQRAHLRELAFRRGSRGPGPNPDGRGDCGDRSPR